MCALRNGQYNTPEVIAGSMNQVKMPSLKICPRLMNDVVVIQTTKRNQDKMMQGKKGKKERNPNEANFSATAQQRRQGYKQ